MNKGNEIYAYLKQNHIGKENAVSSKELEQRFSLGSRSLRRVISGLRKEGCPICSGCTGYYLGKSRKDAGKTADWLNELAGGITESGKTMKEIAREPEEVKIIIIVGGMDDMNEMPISKAELAGRLICFFEENDSHAKERAKKAASQKDVFQEAMQMLDSDLLMRAILEVLDRVRKEEPNYLKRNNYLKLMEELLYSSVMNSVAQNKRMNRDTTSELICQPQLLFLLFDVPNRNYRRRLSYALGKTVFFVLCLRIEIRKSKYCIENPLDS